MSRLLFILKSREQSRGYSASKESGLSNSVRFVVDMLLQVSFTETFNIVAADAVSAGVPVIVSPEIPWLGHYAHRDPTDAMDIADGMMQIWDLDLGDRLKRIQQQRRDLERYCSRSAAVWTARFG